MNYEKKYKDALERARIWKEKSGMPKNKQGILDDIFPELRESEDEKIRKMLITFVKNDCIIASDENKQDALAWLEKQGEQKPQRIISAEAKEAMYDKPAWSEEDEEELDNIIDFLNSPFTAELCPTLRSNAIAWLKSLKDKVQHQWKPSEEHIRYLQAVVNDINNIGSESCSIALRDLLEQLKKL